MRILAGLLALTLSLAASAQDEGDKSSATVPDYRAGTHYEVLAEPVPTTVPDKIEVMEIFAYTCGHCFNFEPLLQAWEKEQPDDVAVVSTPAIWNRQMEVYARGFYTAQALGLYEQVHMPVFTAMHQEGKQFPTAEAWADLLAEYGADREKALKTFTSWGVTQKVSQADQRVRNYKITGTPELVVEGKYRISAKMAGSHAEMLRVAGFLVAKERNGS